MPAPQSHSPSPLFQLPTLQLAGMLLLGLGVVIWLAAGTQKSGAVLVAGLVESAKKTIAAEKSNTTTALPAALSQQLHSFPYRQAETDVFSALPCAHVSSLVSTSSVFPQRQVFARHTTTSPPFWIVIHDSKYDSRRWGIMTEGQYYEKTLTLEGTRTLKSAPPSVVLDIGANIGWLSLLAASLGHKVFSFEPNPSNQMRLCQSMALNKFHDRIEVIPYALGDEKGQFALSWLSSPGQASIIAVDQAVPKGWNRVVVDVITLDEFAVQQGWLSPLPATGTVPGPDSNSNMWSTKIAFMKVDVEGFEPKVFRGAQRLLSSGIVQKIMHECSAETADFAQLRDMFRLLMASGFVPAHFTGLEDINPRPISFTASSPDSDLDSMLLECQKLTWRQCDVVWNWGPDAATQPSG